MEKNLFIKCLSIYTLTTLLCACNADDDYDEIYGSGSPLPENIIQISGHEYKYNEKGLVVQIDRMQTEWDEEGKTVTKWIRVANISYPQGDRAVMEYTYDDWPTTYTFAFGENHFANRVLETDPEESFLHKISYDSEGHLTSLKCSEDELKWEWTNGNLTKIIEKDEYDAYTVITYGNRTGFATYNMSPFLVGVHLGPFMNDVEWWFDRGLKYALYIGFLGKPSVNLPETLTSYDNQNSTPEKGYFEYYTDSWQYHSEY